MTRTTKGKKVEQGYAYNFTPPKQTAAERRIQQANESGFAEGRRYERQQWEQAGKEVERLRAQLKIEQAQAVTALINATTSNLSKAGYLIAQLNKDKGW